MFAQRKLQSACAFAQSDWNLRWAHKETLHPWLYKMYPVKILIRLRECWAHMYECTFLTSRLICVLGLLENLIRPFVRAATTTVNKAGVTLLNVIWVLPHKFEHVYRGINSMENSFGFFFYFPYFFDLPLLVALSHVNHPIMKVYDKQEIITQLLLLLLFFFFFFFVSTVVLKLCNSCDSCLSHSNVIYFVTIYGKPSRKHTYIILTSSNPTFI